MRWIKLVDYTATPASAATFIGQSPHIHTLTTRHGGHGLVSPNTPTQGGLCPRRALVGIQVHDPRYRLPARAYRPHPSTLPPLLRRYWQPHNAGHQNTDLPRQQARGMWASAHSPHAIIFSCPPPLFRPHSSYETRHMLVWYTKLRKVLFPLAASIRALYSLRS